MLLTAIIFPFHQVYRLDVSMTTVRALVNETGENFNVFRTNTKSALLSVKVENNHYVAITNFYL